MVIEQDSQYGFPNKKFSSTFCMILKQIGLADLILHILTPNLNSILDRGPNTDDAKASLYR